MANSYFQFKQFIIHQDGCAMKVTTDACLFGAWVARKISDEQLIINNCLDIGAGTGLLALMLAQQCHAEIDCVEIDEEAANQAQNNINASPWNDRITVIPGDAKMVTSGFRKEFDVIISNPPFYEKEIRSASDTKNIAHHSDQLTLDELLGMIKKSLAPNGSFFLLLPYKRHKEIKKLFGDHELSIAEIVLVRQTQKHDYFRIMVKGGTHQRKVMETSFSDMSIRNEIQDYSPEFVELLKDYYLHL